MDPVVEFKEQSMAAPRDYGDRLPSDLDDVAPGDPTAGFAEVDYDSQSIKPKGFKARGPRSANPNLGVEEKKFPPRYAYTGLIVKQVKRDVYKVIRQDGLYGTAYTRDDDGVYDAYAAGAYVTMIAGPIKDQWLIVGAPKNLVQSFMLCTNSERIGPVNNQTRIVFDTLVSQRGEAIRLNPGGRTFAARHDTIGMYRVSLKAIVRCIKSKKAGATFKANSDCSSAFANGDEATVNDEFDRFKVDRNVGLQVQKDGCSAVVGFQVPESEYVFQTNTGGGSPIWTDSLVVANYVEAGSKVPQGWLKARCSGAPFLWLGHGDAGLKLRFPNNAPSVGRHLVAQAVNGECVQLKWSAIGGNGYIRAYYDGDIREWVIEDGLVISGPDITPPAANSQVFCNSTTRKIWTCS
jgi:hypothetical protein